MTLIYQTPQTDDGVVTGVKLQDSGRPEITIQFLLPEEFRERIRNRQEYVRFAARSRLARLGINIRPLQPISYGGETATLTATVDAAVRSYKVAEQLHNIVLSGLRVGRLIFCDPERRLTIDQIRQALYDQALKIAVEIDDRVVIHPHRCVYDLLQPLSLDDLLTIVARHDGKTVLNRMQIRRDVDRIVLPPGEGVVTSCTAFLHRHFIVLDSRSTVHGQHFESTVLDPGTTRGTRIFLEFANYTDQSIENPSVKADIYSADEVTVKPMKWFWTGVRIGRAGPQAEDGHSDYSQLMEFYGTGRQKPGHGSYFNRPVAVITDVPAAVTTGKPQFVWTPPQRPRTAIEAAAARYSELATTRCDYYEIEILKQIPPNARATVLLDYFPNIVEHIQLCVAAVERRIKTIVFRQASFEHGPFLSAHDHARLADYEALGIQVLWCNDVFREVALHVYRGMRGFFVPLRNIPALEACLVMATYGSTLPLSGQQYSQLLLLVDKLNNFFAGNLALLTGGGPGAMQQAADAARSLGLLTGCNFLEIVDQELGTLVDFYQTFQQGARHFRQRWFDISSFQLFCIGGVGTLEEIGLTLTDMKLGAIEKGPLVFFGRSRDTYYWRDLVDQLNVIVDEGRGPAWLGTHVLITDDPDEVISFYEQVLELGLTEAVSSSE